MYEASFNGSTGVSADDIRAYDWQGVIGAISHRDCIHYYAPLFAKAEELGQAGDLRGKGVFALLGQVAALLLSRHGDGSGRPVDLLTESDLDALAAIEVEIVDAEMRAKVADILWVRRKDYRIIPHAVEAYLLAASTLETTSMWVPFVDRLERALALGVKLGRNKPLYDKVVAAIKDALLRYEATEQGLGSEHLMGLLLEYRAGDPVRYSFLAGKIAERLAEASHWHFARRYWRVKAAWDRRAHDDQAAALAELAAAETYVSEAEGVAGLSPKPNFMSAAHWMTRGFHALREAHADPARVKQAHKKLLEYQRLAAEHEMHPVEVDLGEIPGMREAQEKMVQMARSLVRGKPLHEAVLILGWHVARPVDPKELRQRVEENAKEFIFNHLFGSTAVSATGKVTDTMPPISPHDSEQTEEALRKEMFLQARQIDWQTRVKWQINPAREQIDAEHPLSPRGLSFVVMHNPFVPRGREGIFLRGLHAGFTGDFLLATHLLIPQLENSIRAVLEDYGMITSKLESDNTQDERDLGWILTHPGMEKVFGADMAFDLRGVLIERFGHNLRNEVAHGLLPEQAFYSDAAIYVWWLALRLCTLPLVPREED